MSKKITTFDDTSNSAVITEFTDNYSKILSVTKLSRFEYEKQCENKRHM